MVCERESVALRVEKDEVVGDVSGGGDEGFDVEGVQRCPEREVAVSDASF